MRKYLTALLIIPITIFFAICAGIGCLSFNKNVPTWIMQTWGKVLLWVGGVKINITGMEHVDPEQPSIYMANHASMIDIPILIAALPVHLRFIFKKSILWIPFLGQTIWAMGMIPIDRGHRQKATASLRKAGERIRSGFHVLIFPEGTRTKDGRLLPFKKGGFRLALQEHVDIIPITLLNTAEICGRNSMLAKPGVVEMVIHPRYSTAEAQLENRHEVIEDMRQLIGSSLPPENRPEPKKAKKMA